MRPLAIKDEPDKDVFDLTKTNVDLKNEIDLTSSKSSTLVTENLIVLHKIQQRNSSITKPSIPKAPVITNSKMKSINEKPKNYGILQIQLL
jgi:hypothetical protein